MGLGHFGGGAAAARWLAAHGAEVIVTDLADAETLAPGLALLEGVPIARYQLGGHGEAEFRNADLLVVNPAVKPGNGFVRLARRSGARITTELELFLEHCPATVVGVTGSNGKSTTAAMIDAILRAEGLTAWLGGNLGGSLLDRLDAIRPEDYVVLEMSSFQLHRMSAARRPRVAVVTSFAPNHLDWHGTLDAYRIAKQGILRGQSADDFAVLNTHDAAVARWSPHARGRLVELPPLDALPKLVVPGRHNRTNAACAAAAAGVLGASPEGIRRALSRFCGLPARQELVATLGGVELYDDSAATTPESTIAAIRSARRPMWLMAGGCDKGLDHAELVAAIACDCRGAAFYGAAGERLHEHTVAQNAAMPCMAVATLRDALEWCLQRAPRGDAIVLSPACSSHDQFRNYQHRSETFRGLVDSLEERYNQSLDKQSA